MGNRRDAGHWTGWILDMWDVGLEGYRKGGIQEMRDSGLQVYKKGESRTGGIGNRRDAGQGGFRTCEM